MKGVAIFGNSCALLSGLYLLAGGFVAVFNSAARADLPIDVSLAFLLFFGGGVTMIVLGCISNHIVAIIKPHKPKVWESRSYT